MLLTSYVHIDVFTGLCIWWLPLALAVCNRSSSPRENFLGERAEEGGGEGGGRHET